MRHAFLIVLVLLLATADLLAQGGGEWPFGASGPFSRGQDLWNMGILGAKASDADRAAPKPSPEGGRRVVRSSGSDGKVNAGPERLRIALLFPEGPAERAGLQVGDVVVGVNGRPFEDGYRAPLAAALVQAEASRKGELTLHLEAAEGRPEEIEIEVPTAGRMARKPTEGKMRAALLEHALDWLAREQDGTGGFPATLSAMNGRVVQTSIAGLAWLGGGSLPGKGPHGKALREALDFVLKNVDARDRMPGGRGGSNWNQTNWSFVHAAIFLGELQARAPTQLVGRELTRLTKAIIERQEASGGWAHGPGGANALGYVELNIMTALAVSALGLAEVCGIEVDPEAVRKAEAYLEASSNGGGVGYSDDPGQKGQGNIGRSAGVFLGLQNLGRTRSGFGAQVKSYVARNAGAVLEGHASLMQHVFLAGIAAQAIGGRAEKKFWEALENDLVLARAPDGSFQPRPWEETVRMGSNSDVSTGQVWTTACWACVLAADPDAKKRRGLPGWQGRMRRRGR